MGEGDSGCDDPTSELLVPGRYLFIHSCMHRQEFHEDLSYARPETGASNLQGIHHIHTANIWIQTGPGDPTKLRVALLILSLPKRQHSPPPTHLQMQMQPFFTAKFI